MTEEKKPIVLGAANVTLTMGPKEEEAITRYGIADLRVLKEAEELLDELDRFKDAKRRDT